MAAGCSWVAAGLVLSATAVAQPVEVTLVSDHCEAQQCLLLWRYDGSYAPTGEQLLQLYRRAERYGRGAATLEENILERTLLMRVERRPPVPIRRLGEAGDPCDQGRCAP